MTRAEAERLRPLDLIYVKFGSIGKQTARVDGKMTAGGRLPVRKLRANSGRWTKRVTVVPEQILRRL